MKLVKIAGTMAVGILFLTGLSHSAVKKENPEQVMYELNLHFETGKTDINPKDQADIKKVADELKNYPYAVAQIEGYADSTGSEAFNKGLSQRRAESLKQCLTTQYGIDGNRLQAVGFGETKPVANNATQAGKQRNRAVLVTVNRYMSTQLDQTRQPQ